MSRVTHKQIEAWEVEGGAARLPDPDGPFPAMEPQ